MAACALLAISGAWFLRADLDEFWGQLPALYQRVAARVVLVTTAVAGFVLLARASTSTIYSRTVFGVTLVSSLAYLALYLPQTDGLPWRVTWVALAVMYFAMPNSLVRQVVPPLLLGAGMTLSLLLRPQPAAADLSGDLLVLAIVNAAGFLVIIRRRQLEADVTTAWQTLLSAHRAAEAATREATTLSGIIPLCSHCKDVRTEAGDWQTIEEYMRQHSRADFSHGVCPECLDQLYPKSAINA